jgi:hypothetical protein
VDSPFMYPVYVWHCVLDLSRLHALPHVTKRSAQRVNVRCRWLISFSGINRDKSHSLAACLC